jgi:hypothetical protein
MLGHISIAIDDLGGWNRVNVEPADAAAVVREVNPLLDRMFRARPDLAPLVATYRNGPLRAGSWIPR